MEGASFLVKGDHSVVVILVSGNILKGGTAAGFGLRGVAISGSGTADSNASQTEAGGGTSFEDIPADQYYDDGVITFY